MIPAWFPCFVEIFMHWHVQKIFPGVITKDTKSSHILTAITSFLADISKFLIHVDSSFWRGFMSVSHSGQDTKLHNPQFHSSWARSWHFSKCLISSIFNLWSDGTNTSIFFFYLFTILRSRIILCIWWSVSVSKS